MTFIALCSYANNENICFPSYETIASVVGCSRRKVIDTIKELVALGLIIKHKNTAPNGDAAANQTDLISTAQQIVNAGVLTKAQELALGDAFGLTGQKRLIKLAQQILS